MIANLQREPHESDFAYHKRLVYGKMVDKTLADVDYSELAEVIYDKPYNSDSVRKMLYGSCKTLQLLDEEARGSASENRLLAEIDMRRIELQKERQKLTDQRAAFNRLVREQARKEELAEIMIETISRGELPKLEYHPHCEVISDTDLLVSLCDIHFGANVNNTWCVYNSDVCKRMMCMYLDEVIRIGEMHSSQDCIVWMNGDSINGSIHHTVQVTNKENIIEQITGVSELIAEFLAELSNHFRTVRFVSVAGNHSRIDQKDRALKDERLDDLIEWYLKARLSEFDNVIFDFGEKLDTTMYVMDVRGKKYVGVHGDYDCSREKIQALQMMAGTDIYAVLLGHKHHNAIDSVQGVKTVMAGSFLGMDDYCVSKRIFGKPEQLVCVCDESGIRCTYDIRL